MTIRMKQTIAVIGGVVLLAVMLWGYGVYSARADIEAGLRLGVSYMEEAAEFARNREYDRSRERLERAKQEFARAHQKVGTVPFAILKHLSFMPGAGQAVAVVSLIEIGESVGKAGASLVDIAEVMLPRETGEEERFASPDGTLSILEILAGIRGPLQNAEQELASAAAAFQRIDPDVFRDAEQARFLAVREKFLRAEEAVALFSANEHLFAELLGGNGPRKYLFLLQNNNEVRATGGFIGTYGILEMKQGAVRRFFLDGIFEPDGQLKENIVPPSPIQKISAAWSLHDSNWFPDFPKSAEKAIFFYEKTGGPTVDGVITATPEVLGRLLSALGPVALPEYGITVDATNYLPIIQEQVEEKFDREENKPKKILGDLAGAILEQAFLSHDPERLRGIVDAFVSSLNEKHILIYARAPEVETLVDALQWSGRILPTDRDYLSVVHSNINGYKTDGVIDETIDHRSEIGHDGTIIDTVTITRYHRGGDTPYEWWNKVNADYLRVYVPERSELLSARGATWEFPEAPLDYDALGFRRDADVEAEEQATRIHEASGTRITSDSGKTVFGMWVYVSPKESVTVELRYRLPFSIDGGKLRGDGDRYSVLYQKQSGTKGSALVSEVSVPANVECVWQTSDDLVPLQGGWRVETDLATDRFFGCVLRERS